MAFIYSRNNVKQLIDSGSHSLAIELLKVGIADIVRAEASSNVSLGNRRRELGCLAYSGLSSASKRDWNVRNEYIAIAEMMGYKPLREIIRSRVSAITSRVFNPNY